MRRLRSGARIGALASCACLAVVACDPPGSDEHRVDSGDVDDTDDVPRPIPPRPEADTMSPDPRLFACGQRPLPGADLAVASCVRRDAASPSARVRSEAPGLVGAAVIVPPPTPEMGASIVSSRGSRSDARTVAIDLSTMATVLDARRAMDTEVWFRGPDRVIWAAPFADYVGAQALDGRVAYGIITPPVVSAVGQFAGARAIDLDGDSVAELVAGARVFAQDGTELWSGALGHGSLHPAFFDIDGDGRQEVITGRSIYGADGSLRCTIDTGAARGAVDGGVWLLDLDDDEIPEVLVAPTGGAGFRGYLRVQSLGCDVLRNVHVSELHPQAVEVGAPWIIAPMFEPGRPAVAVDLWDRMGDSSSVRTALLDETLTFRRWSPMRPHSLAVDLDGDGLFEILGGTVREHAGDAFGPAEDIHALTWFNPRTGEIVALGPPGETAFLGVADVEGDGSAELITAEVPASGSGSLRVYESAGAPWASSYHFHHVPLAPYNFGPDGEFWSGPVSWRHQGMYNAAPSADWWIGRGSDLVVRIAGVCEIECEDGRVFVWLQVGNQGSIDVVRPLVVRLFGERGDASVLLAEDRLHGAPAGRWSPARALQIPVGDYDRLRAVVEGDGWAPEECDRTNNEDTYEGVCP